MCSLNIRLEDLAASLTTEDVLKLSQMILEKTKSEKKDGTTSTSSSDTMTDQPSMLPDGYIYIRDYLNTHETIEPIYFFKKCNDLVYNHGFTRFRWNYGTCPLCARDYPHECCASCKRESTNCRCVYRCALAYPSTYTPRGDVMTWAKCTFYANTNDEKSMREHMRVCEGTITRDLKITFLKVRYHPQKYDAIETKPETFDLNKHRCKICNKIHDPQRCS